MNTPLSCSVGDYKSKLQLCWDSRGHSSILYCFFPPSFLVPLRFPQTFPSLSHHHSIAQTYPASDVFIWDLCVTSSSFLSVCKDRADKVQETQRKPTISIRHRHRKHVPRCVCILPITGVVSSHFVRRSSVCISHMIKSTSFSISSFAFFEPLSRIFLHQSIPDPQSQPLPTRCCTKFLKR